MIPPFLISTSVPVVNPPWISQENTITFYEGYDLVGWFASHLKDFPTPYAVLAPTHLPLKLPVQLSPTVTTWRDLVQILPHGKIFYINNMAVISIGEETPKTQKDLLDSPQLPFVIIASKNKEELIRNFCHLFSLSWKISKKAHEFLSSHLPPLQAPIFYFTESHEKSLPETIEGFLSQLGMKLVERAGKKYVEPLNPQEVRERLQNFYDGLLKPGQYYHISSSQELKKIGWIKGYQKIAKQAMVYWKLDSLFDRQREFLYQLIGWMQNQEILQSLADQAEVCIAEALIKKPWIWNNPFGNLPCLQNIRLTVHALRIDGTAPSIERIHHLLRDWETLLSPGDDTPLRRDHFFYPYIDLLKATREVLQEDQKITLDHYLQSFAQTLFNGAYRHRKVGSLFDCMPFSNGEACLFSPGPAADSRDIWLALKTSDQWKFAFSGFHYIPGKPHILEADANGLVIGWGTPELEERRDPRVTWRLNYTEIFKDQDGDKITDLLEKHLGTDPQKRDTDDDGIPDNEDSFPTKPQEAKPLDLEMICAKARVFMKITPLKYLYTYAYHEIPIIFFYLSSDIHQGFNLPYGWIFPRALNKAHKPQQRVPEWYEYDAGSLRNSVKIDYAFTNGWVLFCSAHPRVENLVWNGRGWSYWIGASRYNMIPRW